MNSRRGAFIVIEGTDGSGKGTQFQLLKNRLIQAGYQVEAFDFPQYDQPSSYFVTQYLNGKYGTADEVGPYTASLFYALDRYEAAPRIRQALGAGKIVISNRYTGSSMGHQGTKFRNPEERRGYFIWLDNLEFEMLHIPRPDVSFVLRVPADIAQNLVDQKGERTYTDKKRDIHEADIKHLERALSVYDDLTQLFPKDFQRIDCVRGGKLLDVETVQSMLWEKVVPLLPQPPQLEMPMPAEKAEATTEPEAPPPSPDKKTAGGQTGPSIITAPSGDVFTFTSAIDPSIIAALVASLARGGNELTTSMLEAFVEAAAKDEAILKRTIRAYGAAVQQLIHQHLIISNASHLLAAKVESRLATYVTPEARYLRYEHKDANGMYKYYLPPDLEGDLAVQYRQAMDHIFDLYAQMLPTLHSHMQEVSGVPVQGRGNEWQTAMLAEAREVLRLVLPVAAYTTIGTYASAASFETQLIHLLSDTLPEAQAAGQKMLQALRATIPTFLETVDQPDQGGSEMAYRRTTHEALEKLAHEHLPVTHSAEAQSVQLVSVWPRNELDLIADMLYEHSSLPLRALRAEVINWPYSRKLAIFEAYTGERLHRRERPGRALEQVRYNWDIMCDFASFRELQQHHRVDDPEWQTLTPRYGYNVPSIIEAAGLSDAYEECFDASLALYSALQEAGYPTAAQYAVLLGHKMRFKMTYNAREAFRIHELHTTSHTNPAIRALVEQLQAALTEVHPLIGEAMVFAGQDENSELDKLSVERYEQFKRQA